MTLAHYDALTARAFDRLDTSSQAAPRRPAPAVRDTIKLHNQRMDEVSRVSAAAGRLLLHLVVWGLGMIALWVNMAP